MYVQNITFFFFFLSSPLTVLTHSVIMTLTHAYGITMGAYKLRIRTYVRAKEGRKSVYAFCAYTYVRSSLFVRAFAYRCSNLRWTPFEKAEIGRYTKSTQGKTIIGCWGRFQISDKGRDETKERK